jgi:hypothetical protein
VSTAAPRSFFRSSIYQSQQGRQIRQPITAGEADLSANHSRGGRQISQSQKRRGFFEVVRCQVCVYGRPALFLQILHLPIAGGEGAISANHSRGGRQVIGRQVRGYGRPMLLLQILHLPITAGEGATSANHSRGGSNVSQSQAGRETGHWPSLAVRSVSTAAPRSFFRSSNYQSQQGRETGHRPSGPWLGPPHAPSSDPPSTNHSRGGSNVNQSQEGRETGHWPSLAVKSVSTAAPRSFFRSAIYQSQAGREKYRPIIGESHTYHTSATHAYVGATWRRHEVARLWCCVLHSHAVFVAV